MWFKSPTNFEVGSERIAQHTVYEVKRFIGRAFDDVESDMQKLTYPVIRDELGRPKIKLDFPETLLVPGTWASVELARLRCEYSTTINLNTK